MSNIKKYKNGNYVVTIDLDDGTKIRYNNEDGLEPEFPESMDITISSKCNNGCEFCYAGCTPDGVHADILSPSFIDHLRPYTELALNGNEPLHPDLVPFLEKCKQLKLIPSLTVSQTTFMKNLALLHDLCDKKLVYGLGVSLQDANDSFINEIQQFQNAVIHVVSGIVSIDDLAKLRHHGLKILILGYKRVGRGVEYGKEKETYIYLSQALLKDYLKKIISWGWFKVISFDNLAIDQLDVNSLMSEDEWDKFYMGDDGKFSMYIDMVNKTFSKNSMSTEHYALTDDIKEMFDTIREVSR